MKREVLNSTKNRTVWLSRDANRLELHYCLVTTPEAFATAFEMVNPGHPVPAWLDRSYGARCFPVTDPKTNELHIIVSFNAHPKGTPIENACLLVHEAVHVFQYANEKVGETSPGDEQEAYSIQHIAQCLMLSYAQTL